MTTNIYRVIHRNGLKMMESYLTGDNDKTMIKDCTTPDSSGWVCSKISKQKYSGDLDKAIEYFNGTVIWRQDE